MTEPVLTLATVAVASELAYCHGTLREWESLGSGWYRCGCCGVERKLVGTRG